MTIRYRMAVTRATAFSSAAPLVDALDSGHAREPRFYTDGPGAAVDDVLLQQAEEGLHSRVVADRPAPWRTGHHVPAERPDELTGPPAIAVQNAPCDVPSSTSDRCIHFHNFRVLTPKLVASGSTVTPVPRVPRDPHNVLTQLFRIRIRHSEILATRPQGKPFQVSPDSATGPSAQMCVRGELRSSPPADTLQAWSWLYTRPREK